MKKTCKVLLSSILALVMVAGMMTCAVAEKSTAAEEDSAGASAAETSPVNVIRGYSKKIVEAVGGYSDEIKEFFYTPASASPLTEQENAAETSGDAAENAPADETAGEAEEVPGVSYELEAPGDLGTLSAGSYDDGTRDASIEGDLGSASVSYNEHGEHSAALALEDGTGASVSYDKHGDHSATLDLGDGESVNVNYNNGYVYINDNLCIDIDTGMVNFK